MSEKVIRIGGAAAAWGDTTLGARQLIETGKVHYLIGDYLAEVTMALLARAKAKTPQEGYVPDWLASIKDLLPEIKRQGIKLVTNSGGMNPLGCRDTFMAAASEAGLNFKVAVVTGDDLTPQAADIAATAPKEMFSEAALPKSFTSINAYLGATAIADALDAGAEVVITGRIVDSALALGPLMHEFGWQRDDYNRLAAGSLAGHVIECGAQATGGLFTDWEEVADSWHNMGLPIVECHENGDFIVTKPTGTGGKVSVGTIAEQIVYEIGDPRAYRLPDVTCDFSEVTLELVGDDRVLVSNAKGRAPSTDYKVCGTYPDGFRLLTTYLVAGWRAGDKARCTAEALLRRTNALLAAKGFAPYREVSIEVIGAEDTYGAGRRDFEAREVVVKIGVKHDDAKALQIFSREFAHPAVSMAQGITGMLHGRPTPSPVLRVHSFLWPKAKVPVSIHIAGATRQAEIACPPAGDDVLPHAAPTAPTSGGETTKVPLRMLAWGRSGDKGDHANIGIIARRVEFYPYLAQQVTEERMAAFFAHYLKGTVRRYPIPGFHALNFMLENVLGGGGTASLRYDPQAKSYAQMFLDLPVEVPAAWLQAGGPLASAARG